MSKVFTELVKLGMTEEAAGEIAESLRLHEGLATKQDLLAMRSDLRADLAELKAALFQHTTDTLIKVTAIYAGIVLLQLPLFAFATARLLGRL